MANETVEDFVSWLAERPQTLGWDVILAYDQYKVNTLLAQEYIQRFNSESYFEPLTFDVPMGADTSWEYVYNHILDAPRLSFETSAISESIATLTMRITGGIQLSVNKIVGESRRWISRVKVADAVNGPLLRMNINLSISEGTIDEVGRVTLDLSRGTLLYVTIGDSMEQDIAAGIKYKERFDKWEPEKKVFELNTLKSDPGALLQPDAFFIRTHPAPGGTDFKSPNFGEGEVLLFVSMKDRSNGSIPAVNANMHYLIPQGEPSDPLSATILVGNSFLLEKIVSEGFRRIAKGQSINIVAGGEEDKYIESLTPDSGAFCGSYVFHNVPDIKTLAMTLALPFNEVKDGTVMCEFFADITGGILMFTWNGKKSVDLLVAPMTGASVTVNSTFKWRWRQSFKFSSTLTGELSMIAVDAPSNEQIWKMTPDGFEDTEIEEYTEEIVKAAESVLKSALDDCKQMLTGTVTAIDAFRLNGLLFRTQNAVVPIHSHFAGDLALLGKIDPSLTGFAVEPREPVVASLGEISFKTQPVFEQLTWSVENLPDDEGDPGTIDSQGKYTAPVVGGIKGYQKRVLVKAVGTNARGASVSSTALVSIVERDIAIDPLVFVVTARGADETPAGHPMSAAVLGGEALTWSLKEGSTAQIINEPEPTPGIENQKCFVPPVREAGKDLTLEEISVARASRIGTQHTSVAVVVHAPGGSYFIKTTETPEDVRRLTLRLFYTNKNGEEVEVPVNETTFQKLYGDGELSSEGIYELPDAPVHRFAVLKAEKYNEESWNYGFLIVPNPIVDLQQFCSLLNGTETAPCL